MGRLVYRRRIIHDHFLTVAVGLALSGLGTARADGPTSGESLRAVLEGELDVSMNGLATEDGTRPYFLAYSVYDEHTAVVAATLGALAQDQRQHERNLNIELRVGDYALDNTHVLRQGGVERARGSGNLPIALDDDPESIRHTLWLHTDRTFKRAVKRFEQIRTNLRVKVEEEDASGDFSREAPQLFDEPPATLTFDQPAWQRRMKRVSALAREHPLVHESAVIVGAYAGTRTLVSSEGTRLRTASTRYRITLTAATTAADGMRLEQTHTFNAAQENRLPDDGTIERAFGQVIEQVLALREAPLAEPYIGPAILRNRASGVFFHEIFGHRIEGHRQKDVSEGQTFTKKIGEPVLPEFLDVYDDPSLARFGDEDLRGHYLFDDEGVKAIRALLVDKGVLKSFLLSRNPVEGFPKSNGHGRCQPGNAVAARQANLVVESARQVSFTELREMLLEECRGQGKPYGLLFEDISGGFTMTGRRGPQSFKVLPIVVYRVFPDGRPDELIRGVDLVGTPLTCFEKILATADDPAVFNGSCGAESGWVPVSAVSPSILVKTIEVEKRTREQDRPPILPPPFGLEPPS